MTKTVLHVHQDYPDGVYQYPYTKAVSNLVHAVEKSHPEYKHYVISINRTANPFKVKWQPFDGGMAFVYWGIPFQFMHFITLWLATLLIRLAIRGQHYDLVHSHKLTTEGFIGAALAKEKKCPHFISIRGGSDCYNLKRFARFSSFYQPIYQNAKQIFWVSPWAAPIVQSSVAVETQPMLLFPNICEIDLESHYSSKQHQSDRFISVISYDQYERKGFLQLLEAMSQLKEQGVYATLDIYGYGSQHVFEMLKTLIKNANIHDRVFLKGRLSQVELRSEMSQSIAMVLPSMNETFGMSYIEALSVGCPIMYMADTGVDGFFSNYNIGVKLNSQASSEIKDGLLNLLQNQSVFQHGLQQMQKDQYLKLFTADTLVNRYMSELKRFI